MRRILLVLFIVLKSGFVFAGAKEQLAQVPLEHPEAFLGWKTKDHWSTDGRDIFALPKVELGCSQTILVPTHPQQTTKQYHLFYTGAYNALKLPAKSRLCRVKSNGEKPRCLAADSMEYALISDIYRDLCGNLYRGYWQVSFAKKDETMGTLFSKGRWAYSDPKSQFENDMKEGPTYALETKDFMFLTEIFDGDQKQMSENLERALKYTHDLDPRTLLFTEKP